MDTVKNKGQPPTIERPYYLTSIGCLVKADEGERSAKGCVVIAWHNISYF